MQDCNLMSFIYIYFLITKFKIFIFFIVIFFIMMSKPKAVTLMDFIKYIIKIFAYFKSREVKKGKNNGNIKVSVQ